MLIDFQLYTRPELSSRLHYATFVGKLNWTESDLRTALSASTTVQRCAEIECSVEMTEREERSTTRRGDLALARLRGVAAKYGATVDWSGDPRGCPTIVYPDTADGYKRRYPID